MKKKRNEKKSDVKGEKSERMKQSERVSEYECEWHIRERTSKFFCSLRT